MSHDYQPSVAGTDLDTLVNWARFLKYAAGRKRGSNLVIPYRHGELYVPDKYFTSADVLLEVGLPGNAADDGREALTAIQRLFAAQDEVVVAQNDPELGDIRARVELLTEPVPSQNRLVYVFGLRNASGFWEDVTASTATSANPPSVTTGGDRPIDDMILTFAGPGFLEHTDELGQKSRITIDAGAGAGTYVVDCGLGTVVKGSTDQDEFLTCSQPWWMKWSPGAAQAFTSNVNVAASWRNKYA